LSYVVFELAPLLERPRSEDVEAHPPIKAIPSTSSTVSFNFVMVQLLEFDTSDECIFRTAEALGARMGKNTARTAGVQAGVVHTRGTGWHGVGAC
jgi:hypothetical protein